MFLNWLLNQPPDFVQDYVTARNSAPNPNESLGQTFVESGALVPDYLVAELWLKLNAKLLRLGTGVFALPLIEMGLRLTNACPTPIFHRLSGP